MPVLSIQPASPAHQQAFLEMIIEFEVAGERYGNYDQARQDLPAYLRRLELDARGEDILPLHVPQTTYWLFDENGYMLGESRLRHTLNDDLLTFGGHIGYRVRPSVRRQGFATRLLALTLEKAREMGLTRVLVTCDDSNLASARVIEANGGVLENRLQPPGMLQLVRRYWIDL